MRQEGSGTDGNEPALAAYLRVVAMVVNGDELEEAPAAFRDYIKTLFLSVLFDDTRYVTQALRDLLGPVAFVANPA